MPWGDGTGPMGEGPMTGRRLGYCAGYGAPGYAGGGRGLGLGRGRGWRHRYFATGLPGWARGGFPPVGPVAGPAGVFREAEPRPDETSVLKAQVEYLEAALEETRVRLAELDKGQED
jgi:hypothetical protein